MKVTLSTLAFISALVGTSMARAEGPAADPFDDMISPVSHPVTFEDPRQSTELRPIFAYHSIGDDFVTNGGDAQVYAMQARFKLTDSLSIIATKDGIVTLKANEVVNDSAGLANLAGGLKYTVYKSAPVIVSAALKYEAPTGKEAVFQGHGNGAINPLVSMGYTANGFSFIGGTGIRESLTDRDSSFWDLDLHVDYKLGNFYPLAEFNMVHCYQAGSRLPIPDEGQDFFNFGSSGAAGSNLISGAVGARYRVLENLDVGAAYQFPLRHGDGENLLDWRITTDAIIRF